MKIEHTDLPQTPLEMMLNYNIPNKEQWLSFLPENNINRNYKDMEAAYLFRESYITHIGYSIYTHENIETLSQYLQNKKTLDLGSGSGYLSLQLEKNGIDILAIDNESTHKFINTFKRDITGDLLEYLKTPNTDYTDVILSWPPYSNSLGKDVLDIIKPGTTIWMLGEGYGGCCATDEFFEQLESDQFLYLDVPSKKLNNDHINFGFIHDYWQVYKKL